MKLRQWLCRLHLKCTWQRVESIPFGDLLLHPRKARRCMYCGRSQTWHISGIYIPRTKNSYWVTVIPRGSVPQARIHTSKAEPSAPAHQCRACETGNSLHCSKTPYCDELLP